MYQTRIKYNVPIHVDPLLMYISSIFHVCFARGIRKKVRLAKNVKQEKFEKISVDTLLLVLFVVLLLFELAFVLLAFCCSDGFPFEFFLFSFA